MSKKIINNTKRINNNKIHIYHSHISNEVIGYAHSFCNERFSTRLSIFDRVWRHQQIV